MGIAFRTQDLQNAIRDIDRYADGARAKVKKAIATTVFKVHAKAVRAAPVASKDRKGKHVGGTLKGSIQPTVNPDGLSGEVGTNIVYAARLEFGFAPDIRPNRGIDSLGRRFNQRPRPYLFPAAESERNDHERRMKEAVR